MSQPARQLATHASDGTLALATRAEDTWLALADLRAAFDSTSDRGRQDKAERWARELPAAMTQRRGRSLYVRGDARLPDNLTAVAFVRTGQRKTWNGFAVPSDFDSFTPADRQRFSDTHLLLDRWESFRAANRNLPEAALVARFAAHMISEGDGAGTTIADWSASLPSPLRVSERTLREYKARVTPGSDRFDGNRDQRGRKPLDATRMANEVITEDGEVRDAAFDYFLSLLLDQRRRSAQLCYELTSERADGEGWLWPSIHSVRRRYEKLMTESEADHGRLGPTKWSRKHLPRVERDMSKINPNECWVGDHHRCDLLVMHDDKPYRPWLTGWLDQKSRLLVGWRIGLRASCDSIIGALAEGIIAHGAPNQLLVDNGKDYRAYALSTARSAAGSKSDETRAAGVCERWQIDVHFAKPFNPQSKSIERFFETVKDRFVKLPIPECVGYVGGKPDERPEDLYRDLAKRRIVLPSLDALREAFAAWVVEYHTRVHTGTGMESLSPIEMFDRDAIARRTLPAEQIKLALRRQVLKPVTRDGICIGDGLYYGHGNMAVHRYSGSKVLCVIDDSDLSAIEVYTADGRTHITTATNARLTDATRDDLRDALTEQRRIARATKAAREVATDALLDREQLVQRKVAARRKPAPPLAATGTDHDRPLKLMHSDMPLPATRVAVAAPSRVPTAYQSLAALGEPSSETPARAASFSSFAKREDDESPTEPTRVSLARFAQQEDVT